MQPREVGAGSIYDLGYRNYTGRRLGRLNAFMTLFWFSLRSAFGISRGGRAKIIPMGLAAIVFVPAAIQLGIAAIASDAIDFIRPEEYYGFVFIIIALFTAAIAPELVGRDQRNHTLALYFSRPLLRSDYALAKLGAAAAALLVLTLGPQVLLFVGNAFAGNDFWGYLSDEGDTILPVLATAVILSVYISGIGLAIAAQTPRRAYASGAIIALFVVSAAAANIFVSIADGDGFLRYLVFISPFEVGQGVTYWLFQVDLPEEDAVGVANLASWLFGLAAVAWAAIPAWILYRRYQRIAA